MKVEAHELPTIMFGDSDALRPGQIVLAFGSPLGLESSVSMGVVCAVARQLTPEDPMIYIQTDATINPGNSGGALVDTEGRLVGINTLIYSQSGGNEGIGFAAPSNIVQSVYRQIRANGRVRRGSIGVTAQTITPSLAEGLGLPRKWGVILADVLIPQKPLDTISAVYFGMIVGLFLAYVAGLALTPLFPAPPQGEGLRGSVQLILATVISYVCISLLIQTRHDFRFIIPYVEFSKEVKGGRPYILDTSVVIDGRIADVVEASVFDAQLVRNRHGPVGRWIMEWNCDECLFTEPAPYPQPLAATPAHRPHQAAVIPKQRRAG